MTGINKKSSDPKSDQKKMKINPLYNTFAIIKAVGDRINSISEPPAKKKSK